MSYEEDEEEEEDEDEENDGETHYVYCAKNMCHTLICSQPVNAVVAIVEGIIVNCVTVINT